MSLKDHVSGQGSVDVSRGVPPGCHHVSGKRLTITARKLGVEAYPAIVEWGRRYPKLDGVVVGCPADAKRLIDAHPGVAPGENEQQYLQPSQLHDLGWNRKAVAALPPCKVIGAGK